MFKKSTLFLIIFFLLFEISLISYNIKPQKLKINFCERFRFVSWDNAINLDDSSDSTYSFTRHRTSISLEYLPSIKFELGLKLTNEFRTYLSPSDKKFNFNEIFFDQLYIKWKHLLNLPITLTLGRQNIMLGEGFVCFDGQPLTGSRSAYFNALRADFKLSPNHKIILFYSYVPEKDYLLPILNNQDQHLIEQAHKGIGLYYTGEFNKTGIDAYYIKKETDVNESYPIKSKIDTFGARVTTQVSEKLGFTVEYALQSGSYGNLMRKASGGYFHIDYSTEDILPILNKVTFGGIFLTGDNPNTEKIEAWDPVFSRWPKWSESYIYTLIRENSVAYWSNLNSIYLTLSSTFSEKINFKLSFYHIGAKHHAPLNYFPGGTGKIRGNLIIGKLTFKINNNLTSHFVWENFNPGNFYFDEADIYNWLRFELMLNF